MNADSEHRLCEVLRHLRGELKEERSQRHPDACWVVTLREEIADARESLRNCLAKVSP